MVESRRIVDPICRVTLYIGLALYGGTVAAQPVDVQLPSQPLSSALHEFSRQSGLQLAIRSDLIDSKMAPSVHGHYEPEQALVILLQGSGLIAYPVNSRTYGIRRISANETAPSAPVETGGLLHMESERPLVLAQAGPESATQNPPNPIKAGDKGLGTTLTSPSGVTQQPQALDEIVVTAQKRSERLLDVPMSVAAVSGDQLRTAGIGSTLELQEVTPGLVTVNNGLGFSPSIRGVSSAGTTPGDETNVALYVDDVYVGAPIAGFFDLQDIDRVEILKGPQGTLFGRNATGGAVRIQTRAPSFTPQLKASADYGFNFEELNLGAYATGPLGGKFAGAVSGSYRTGDGFVEGVGPDVGHRYAKPDNYVYRAKLLFQPNDTFHATAAADVSRSQNDNVFIAVPANNANAFPGPGSVGTTTYHYAGSTQPEALVKGHSFTLDAIWEPVNWLTARSISGYRTVNGAYQADLDRTSRSLNALGLAQNQQNFSQEFNFSSPSDQPITWLLGAYYYHSDAGNPYFTVFLGDAPGGRPASNFTDAVRTASYAGFGDLTWNATSQLHLTAGARYSTETKDYRFQSLIPIAAPKTSEKTWNSPTFRTVARYDFARDANVYASWSDGFKSGVYNAYSPLAIPVSPEKIDAFEIGAKARLNRITLTAAAYAYNYKDLQVQTHVTINGAIVTTLANAGRAEIRGMEFTGDGNLTDELSFGAGVSWLPTAKYTEYPGASVVLPCPTCTPPVVGVTNSNYDASGSRMIKAPDWTANLRLTYTVACLGGHFAGTVSDAYSPGFYWQPGNLSKEPSYNVTNARLSWTDSRELFTYSVWGTNLTDALYSTYTTANVRSDSRTYPEPRQIGIGVAVQL